MTSTIQARIKTIAESATGFSKQTVSLGDFKIIDKGKPPYAIITPGPVKIKNTSVGGLKTFEWTYYIDVIARFLDDSYEPLLVARQAMLDKLLPYQKLNELTGILSFLVTEVGGISYIYPRGNKEVPQFVMQQLTTETVTNTSYAGSGDFA